MPLLVNSVMKNDGDHIPGEVRSRYYQGVVKSFNSREGYGFISCNQIMQEYGCDVFMHKKQFFASTVFLRIGDHVKFRLEFSKQGKPQARDLKRVEGSPVEVLKRENVLRKIELEQVSVLQPDEDSIKRKRKVSFKEGVEVLEAGETRENADVVEDKITSPHKIAIEEHMPVSPLVKHSTEISSNLHTEETNIGRHIHEAKTSLHVGNTKKFVSPRLENRVISTDEASQTSEHARQSEKEQGEAVKLRLEEGVINKVLLKVGAEEAAAVVGEGDAKAVSKKDTKKGARRKRVTFKLAEDIIGDSDSGGSSVRSPRVSHNKGSRQLRMLSNTDASSRRSDTFRARRLKHGMMKNFGATVRRKVKNLPENEGSKGLEELQTETNRDDLSKLASEMFEKLMRVQKESKTKKVNITPKPKPVETSSDPKADPAYMDWSLGFGSDESNAPSDPKIKIEQGASSSKNCNVGLRSDLKVEDGEKKDSKHTRKRDEWFHKPPLCAKPKVPPREAKKESSKWAVNSSRKANWGPRVVLTEVQVRERGPSKHSTHESYSGYREECKSRNKDDRDHRSDNVETFVGDRRCNSKISGQLANNEQPAKLLDQELPIRKYKFPRPLDGHKRRK